MSKEQEKVDNLNSLKDELMQRFNEIKEVSAKDMEIDDIDLDAESLRTPKLYSKYNNMYSDELIKLRQLYSMKEKINIERWKWLSGKQTNKYYADYGVPNEKVLKGDLDMYLKSDSIYIAINEVVGLQKLITDMLEKTCKEISNRGFHIKSAIDWRRFCSGG
jgi:hypothetical protein